MMFKTFNNFINENINSMVYGPTRNHELPEIAIDELPLIEPPSNDSEETKRELEYIKDLPNVKDIDKKADKDFSKVFADYLASKNNGPGAKNIKKDRIDNYSNRIKQIVIALKNHFNRPRPYQLAPYHNIDLDVYNSKTSSTPSYPSGHSTQPFAIAQALSYEYPELKDELFSLADEIAKGRMRMKVHFPSDYEYGKLLGVKIGKLLKF